MSVNDPVNPPKPIAYGYCRVSTLRQSDEGMSLGAQQVTAKKFFEFALEPKGVIWGEAYIDGGVSAAKTKFGDRPAGGALMKRLRSGDHVIMTRLDRGFRNFRDCMETMDVWVKAGVHVHFIDLGVSTNTHGGRFILRIFAAIAELNREMMVEQIKAGLQRRKDLCGAANKARRGYVIVGTKKNPKQVPDLFVQGVAMLAMRLNQEQNMSFEAIYRLFRDKGLRTKKGTLWLPQALYLLAKDAHREMWNVPEATFPDNPPRVPRSTTSSTRRAPLQCEPPPQTGSTIASIVTES